MEELLIALALIAVGVAIGMVFRTNAATSNDSLDPNNHDAIRHEAEYRATGKPKPSAGRSVR